MFAVLPTAANYKPLSLTAMVCQGCWCQTHLQRLPQCWCSFERAGVIVESEDLHREAYNAAFAHFKACIPGKPGNIEWSEDFYDDLQNKVGGGKAKMRWYFGNLPLLLAKLVACCILH